MDDLQDIELPPLRTVTLQVGGRSLSITPPEATQIAAALRGYLTAHRSTRDGVPLPPAVGDAWVDSRGTLRVGAWALAAQGDTIVLALRDAPPPGATSGSQFTVSLVRTPDGWHIPAIGRSRLQYR